jgi:hypothetical protein
MFVPNISLQDGQNGRADRHSWHFFLSGLPAFTGLLTPCPLLAAGLDADDNQDDN